MWGWELIIFDERNIFLGPQGPIGTILVPVEIELVPRIGTIPSIQVCAQLRYLRTECGCAVLTSDKISRPKRFLIVA